MIDRNASILCFTRATLDTTELDYSIIGSSDCNTYIPVYAVFAHNLLTYYSKSFNFTLQEQIQCNQLPIRYLVRCLDLCNRILFLHCHNPRYYLPKNRIY